MTALVEPGFVCAHKNVYQDDLVGDWHCDDCGAYWPDDNGKPKEDA